MSSDSEDDFYGNITERLQKEKEKFVEERVETANLFDDSAELDEIVENNKIPQKNKKKNTRKSSEEAAGSSVSDLPDVSVDSNARRTSKRVTRSSARNSDLDGPAELELPPPRPKRQKSYASAGESSQTSPNNTGTSRGRGRGNRARGRGRTPRGRGRGRGRRNRVWMNRYESQDMISELLAALGAQMHRNSWDSDSSDSGIPTYSVGNTAEYPDQSHEQPLFSSNTQRSDDVVVVEEENLDNDNEELCVKVYWQSSETYTFQIRRFQKLAIIYNFFAQKEKVTHDKLLFIYNDKILKSDDTPHSIEYSIAKFIDGGIVTQGVSNLQSVGNEKIKDGIKIKFQCQNMKKPFETTVRLDDKLSFAMMQCSEHLEKPLDKLKFEFDGDSISGKSTARELEFEGGECIDVRILS